MRRLRGERGATTELVVLFPALFVLLILGIQFALYYHASHVALAAAQEGARTARVTDNIGAGQDSATAFLVAVRQGALVDGRPRGRIDPDGTAHMEVTGRAQSILPGFTFTIHEESQGPVEVFRGDR